MIIIDLQGIEDFFGAWTKNEDYSEDTEDLFDPDYNWQRIFPLP